MSNDLVTAPKQPVVSAAECADWAMLLARSVRQRRQELGLSVQRAAQLGGMELSDWYALEAGWVPEEQRLRSIAGTLEIGYLQLSFIAEVSRYNQEVLFSSQLPLAS